MMPLLVENNKLWLYNKRPNLSAITNLVYFLKKIYLDIFQITGLEGIQPTYVA